MDFIFIIFSTTVQVYRQTQQKESTCNYQNGYYILFITFNQYAHIIIVNQIVIIMDHFLYFWIFYDWVII